VEGDPQHSSRLVANLDAGVVQSRGDVSDTGRRGPDARQIVGDAKRRDHLVTGELVHGSQDDVVQVDISYEEVKNATAL